MRRFLLALLALSAAPLLAQQAPQEIAKAAVQQWLSGKLSPKLDLQEIKGLGPEEAKEWLHRYLAFPPPPPSLQVNLDDPKIERLGAALQVSFPATVDNQGGEIVVLIEGNSAKQVAWRPSGGMIPPWVKSSYARLLYAAATLLLLIALLQGGWRRLWERTATLLGRYRKLYLFCNALFYGLFVLGALWAYLAPDLAKTMQEVIGMAVQTIGLDKAAQMSLGQLAWIIFYWNFSHGLLLTTFVPAFFLGIPALLINSFRYLAFGFALSPATFPLETYLLHVPTLVVELQAYILVTFGGLVLLWETLRGGGFRKGLDLLGYTLMLGTLMLIAGAWYEAFELLYLIH